MHPTLTVLEAMQLVGFSLAERIDKNMQQKILQHLPGKWKQKFKSMAAMASYVNDNISVASDMITRKSI